MFKYIENLRNKPEHSRRKILFFSVGFSMFFIILIWSLSFSARFEFFGDTEKQQAKAPSPFFVLNGFFEEFSDGFRQSADSLKNTLAK